jgi:hypothetical protein
MQNFTLSRITDLCFFPYMNYFPNSVIYGFEPFPKVFKTLLQNCKNNQNIHPYQLAVGDKRPKLS